MGCRQYTGEARLRPSPASRQIPSEAIDLARFTAESAEFAESLFDLRALGVLGGSVFWLR
jgi:hypothetical protein